MEHSQSISLVLGSIGLLSGACAVILIVYQIIIKWIKEDPDAGKSILGISQHLPKLKTKLEKSNIKLEELTASIVIIH